MSECPSIDQLERAADGRLAASEAAAVARHAAQCPDCGSALETARADAALAAELRAVHRARRGAPGGGSDGAGDLAGYELAEELHRGGQGTVFRARERATGREVALKVLAARTARERYRFEREVELARRLRHPAIVAIHDSGTEGERAWCAMELVRGEHLDDHLDRVRPDLRERLALFSGIADAVACAHRHGVIHRDLKPANVLVDREGRPRLLDFGIATSTGDGGARITATGEFLGTLAYASPEQLRGDASAVDTRTDVYSLGVLLYRVVTGRLPHDLSGSVAEAAAIVAGAPPLDPASVSTEVDGDLRAVLLTALAKEPELRYASVEALRRDVEHWLAGEPLEVRPPGAWRTLRRFVARHRVAVGAAGLATVLAGAGVLAVARERLKAERQRESLELVRGVFEDVLAAAAPSRMGGDVRLLEVIQAVAPSIEEDLAGAPDVQAAVQTTIGETYRSLLLVEEAEVHLARAVERLRATGEEGEALARALCLLSLVRTEQSEPGAIEAAEEALRIRRRGRDELALARSIDALGRAHLVRGDGGRARDLLEDALARFERVRAPLEAAETKVWLARALDGPGADDERIDRLLQESAETLGADGRAVLALNQLAARHRAAGRFDLAEEHLDRAVAVMRGRFGEDRTSDMIRRYARLELARGDPAAAERLSREALAAELAWWSRRRPSEAEELEGMATRLAACPEGEEPPYAEAFALLRRFRGEGAYELASWANGIAHVLAVQGRTEATELLLREALHVRCRAWGRDCPVRQRTIDALTELLVADGRCAEALPLLEETLDTFARKDQSGSVPAVRARGRLEACCAGGE